MKGPAHRNGCRNKKFGIGSVRFINPKADFLEIFFTNGGLKTFSLKTYINSDMIHALEPIGSCSNIKPDKYK